MSKKVKIILVVLVLAAIAGTVYYFKVYKPKADKLKTTLPPAGATKREVETVAQGITESANQTATAATVNPAIEIVVATPGRQAMESNIMVIS